MVYEMNITTLVEQINEKAEAYQIGTLQQLRRKLGKNPRTTRIFTKSTIKDTYAFNDGGRQGLQFNIGLELRDKQRWWRHGVAFSFERSHALPDPESLRPNVLRFNDWVRANAGALQGFKMWHDEKGVPPSEDRPPGEIVEALISPGVFVFLGTRVPEDDVNVARILQDLDRLLPLYEYVESSSAIDNTTVRLPEEVPERSTYSEGSVQRILVNRYERDLRAREKCLRHYGTTCALCGFDFVAVYGKVMEGFIHVHHLKSISSVGVQYEVDPIEDLRPVCPNCHAVVHRRSRRTRSTRCNGSFKVRGRLNNTHIARD